MKFYRFYRFDRKGQPARQAEDIQCPSDLQARFIGRNILATEATVGALEIWDGERRVAQLAQDAAAPPATDQAAPRHPGLGDEIDEDTKFGKRIAP